MGGGGNPAPAPAAAVAVPSAADEEAADERSRLYSLLRSRRAGRGLAGGPPRRYSLLRPVKAAAKTAPAAVIALATIPTWDGGGGNPGGYGYGDAGGPSGTGGIGGGVGEGGGGHSGGDDQ